MTQTEDLPHCSRSRGTCMVTGVERGRDNIDRAKRERDVCGSQRKKVDGGWLSPSRPTSHWRQNRHAARTGGGDCWAWRGFRAPAGVQEDRRRGMRMNARVQLLLDDNRSTTAQPPIALAPPPPVVLLLHRSFVWSSAVVSACLCLETSPRASPRNRTPPTRFNALLILSPTPAQRTRRKEQGTRGGAPTYLSPPHHHQPAYHDFPKQTSRRSTQR